MASKTAKGDFIPKNTTKYIGNFPITYRSSWELAVMRFFDSNSNIIAWASESIKIPYLNPLTGRWTFYVPDFLVVYVDKNGQKHAELMEVKPLKETPTYVPKLNERVSKKTKLAQVLNAAKWAAAMQYCAKNGLHFRIATEDQLFAGSKRK